MHLCGVHVLVGYKFGATAMRLDNDLARDILLAIEESESDPNQLLFSLLPDRDQKHVSYHICLLNEAGFIDAVDFSTSDGARWVAKRLTYTGHQFLSTVRDREVWKQTKELAKSGGIEALRAIGKLAMKIAEQEFKKRTGLEL
jgi:hypothetical protein